MRAGAFARGLTWASGFAFFSMVSGVVGAAEWVRTHGGTNYDDATLVRQTADGGFIVAAKSFSFDPAGDGWILKLDASGNTTWQKRYGGAYNDRTWAVYQTSDGGYVVAGYTNSFGQGSYDFWVMKLNSDGTVAWQKTYGDVQSDEASAIQQTTDGGFIVAGASKSFSPGNYDFWVLRLNPDGSVAWQRRYGGGADDYAYFIRETTDHGYILAGYTDSFGAGLRDGWILKLNSSGGVVWSKTFGGLNIDGIGCVQETSDGYIATGATLSYGAGGADVWVLKLDGNGDVVWQRAYGGSNNDFAYFIQPTSDGGFVLAGETSSFGAGGREAWVVKLSSTGNITWQKTLGGAADDWTWSIQQTTDGGYVAAGQSVSFGAGLGDAWVLKLDATGAVAGCSLVGESNATVIPTSVAANPVTPTVSDTYVTPATPPFTPVDTSISPATQCVSYNLTVTVTGTGSGSVGGTGISCPSDCSESLSSGTVVTLTATPDPGSTFAGWSGDPDCSDGQVTMTQDLTCIATFALNEYPITTVVTPPAGGSVICTPNPVPHGQTATCTITVNPGYVLQSVNSTCGGSLVGNTFTTDPLTGACTVSVELAQAQAIPTLSQWGMLLITLAVGWVGVWQLRRMRHQMS